LNERRWRFNFDRQREEEPALGDDEQPGDAVDPRRVDAEKRQQRPGGERGG
jgi:hypothetical protein